NTRFMYNSEQLMYLSRMCGMLGLATMLIATPHGRILADQPTNPSAIVSNQNRNKPKVISLKEGLERLIKETKTGIVYEPEAVEGIEVNVDAMAQFNYMTELVLESWLKDSPLTYNKVSDGTNYVIVRRDANSESSFLMKRVSDENALSQHHFNNLAEGASPMLVKAQEQVIEGRVTLANGDGISGVSVAIDGGEAGAVTDANGRYRIVFRGGAERLVFTSLGFERLSEPIRGREIVNVVLVPVEERMEEVVVDALGFTRKA